MIRDPTDKLFEKPVSLDLQRPETDAPWKNRNIPLRQELTVVYIKIISTFNESQYKTKKNKSHQSDFIIVMIKSYQISINWEEIPVIISYVTKYQVD